MNGRKDDIDCVEVAKSWLNVFKDAIATSDSKAFATCFEEGGWFRDLLVFSWGFKTCHGYDAIHSYVANTWKNIHISNVNLDFREHYAPHLGNFGPNIPLVNAALTFETPNALGQGFVRIRASADQLDRKAFSLVLMIRDWKGHEETVYESGIYDGHRLSWEEVNLERRRSIEKSPTAVIVGAGQTGLNVAARFQQMGIKAIVIEKNKRVGDNWRKRYPTLCLHTPRSHHTLLYQPYPRNWPRFTPKDKLASWLENYAEDQDLVVWTSSMLVPGSSYDEKEKRWTVTVEREGKLVTLHPEHLVMAMSMFGDKVMPPVSDKELFGGEILHSSQYEGGLPYAGKRILVVGTGNSGGDICQDLVFRGAASVTMLQRSPTTVMSDKLLDIVFSPMFPEEKPFEYTDLSNASVPVEAMRMLMKELLPFQKDFDKELHQNLEKAGMKVIFGPDNAGLIPMVFDRGGGYIIDVGVCELIINGSVKVKYGTEVQRLETHKVIFKDGSEIDADVIIFATGYHPIRESLRTLFGNEVVNRTETLWGLDENGELRAGYRPSGQPGLWFALGDFAVSRPFSKQLALYLKAIELGYYSV